MKDKNMDVDFPSAKKTLESYWSVDSAPKYLTRAVPYYLAPALLLTFVFLSTYVIYIFNTYPMFKMLFPFGDLFFYQGYSGQSALSIRLFFICFYISFALFSSKRSRVSASLAAELIVKFLFVCVLIESFAFFLIFFFKVNVHVVIVSVISGVFGFIVFSLVLLERGNMPDAINVKVKAKHMNGKKLEVIVTTIICAVLSTYISQKDLVVVDFLKDWSLLGGIGPGVFLFFPMLFMTYYLTGRIKVMLHRNKNFVADLSVIIPAHNEEYIIAQCIRSIDESAKRYQGKVHVIVANNNSSDNTYDVAKDVIAECRNITGEVVNETKPGKALALNLALSMVTTDYVMRVDADTVLRKNCIRYCMQHFNRDDVGAVGGVPLSPGGGIFDRARAVETVIKHGFYSVSLSGIDAVVSVPGMCVCYRTDLPKQLGGFAHGLNGEDTEISLRIGEAGYRMIVDPRVRYVSEVPMTYHHMREQRMRWYRSVYHVVSRCRKSVLVKKHTIRGLLVMPYLLFNVARRSMMWPLVIYGVIEYSLSLRHIPSLQINALLAMLLGPPMIIAVFALVVGKYFKALLYLPEYFLFRMLRTYYTLESMLSITILPGHANFFKAKYRPFTDKVTAASKEQVTI